MRIVFMGTPDFAGVVLEGLIKNYEVVGVVSQPDKKVGRHQVLQETPVKKIALAHDIEVIQPNKIKEEYEEVLKMKPDIIITCAYGQIIPKEILTFPKYGCINVHASLLPKLRGGAPIHKAIIDGYKTTGITIMYMDEKMDSGDIISQREVEILESDNLESLHDKLSDVGSRLLLDTLPSIIDGTNKRIKQNEDEVTYAFNITREEEHIDFSKEAIDVFNLIRGLAPIPASYASLDGSEMKVYESSIKKGDFKGECGEIIDVTKEGIIVKVKDGAIILKEIKPFSKKRMKAYDYVNGVGKDKLIGKVFE